MPELLIHPGFPKAASTTMQAQLFEAHPNIKFITPHQRYRVDRNNDTKDLIMLRHIARGLDTDQFSNCNRSNRSNEPAEDANALIQLDDCHRGALERFCDEGRLNIFSDETLLMPFRCAISPILMPERVRYLTDSRETRCRVLIIVRNQVDLMHSFYAQKYPKLYATPGSRSICEYYFDSSKRLRENEETTTFDFNTTVRAWEQAFGIESVSVLLFEDLRFNPGLFSNKISEILGVDSASVQEALLPGNSQRVGAKLNGAYKVELTDPLRGYLGAARRAIRATMPEAFFRKVQSHARNIRKRSVVVPEFEPWQKVSIQKRFQQSNIDFAERHGIDVGAMIRFGYVRP